MKELILYQNDVSKFEKIVIAVTFEPIHPISLGKKDTPRLH